MSAHIMGDAHIHAILTFMHSRELHGCHRWENVQDELTDAGRTLLAANYVSYNVRYPLEADPKADAEMVAGYRWLQTRMLSPVEMLKAVQYYEYQACEPDNWEQTEAHKLVVRMRERAICVLPGWEAAPWGFKSESVRLVVAQGGAK